MSRVTLRDIALSLGVSVSTVSLALRGSERISSPVREKIVRRAEALGYRTDLAGSLLRATKPNIIGLTCDVEKELHVAHSREITAPAEELGYLVVTEDMAAGNGANALARIIQLHARAVIVVDPVMTDSAASAAVDVPVVAIGQTAPRQDADLVISNNATGMVQVAELVGDCSHVHHSQVHYLDGGRPHRPSAAAAPSSRRCPPAGRGAGHPQRADRGRRMAERPRRPGRRTAPAAGPRLLQRPVRAGRPDRPVACASVGARGQQGGGFRQHAHRVLEGVRADPGRPAAPGGRGRSREVARLALDLANARARGDRSAPRRLEIDTRVVRRSTA
ncbi:transcriptional regulator, LacI family [Propionibacterium acidifaciens F0233]|mgnify:CR=1 FL=1|uniref:Transcriptional regulator, LacI family n=1 Tax=Propionibacterium acidifaciens F0233 TaxID=553198 RepID=U2QFH6_9ACTN|nr:LacI family DNA-binding transcriptional regulator [Propionibacterium acidifaciens]AYW78744.1 LacI family DNA-binding transcriptional regulator [Propionibacterium acidifaciens]ERK55196.1 transcriptional regulator, LacI family [Propionibacterium acidifaciens F0233]